MNLSGMEVIRKALTPFAWSIARVPGQIAPCIIQSRSYAARRGTRAKADKKKKAQKIEEKKIGFVAHALREKLAKGTIRSRRFDDSQKSFPTDDVWVSKFHRKPILPFKTAVEYHRETHHPQIYNMMDSYLKAFIELDMRTKKKTKFVDTFTRVAPVEHTFNLGEDRTVLVFCKTEEFKAQAEAEGATLVGDETLVKKVEKGEMVLPDFNFVLAHPNILPEMVCLRGLLKKKFPSPKFGNLAMDVGAMVRRFKYGIQYTAARDENELDYGFVDAPIGTLNMEIDHLEMNLRKLVDDIMLMKPMRTGPFITRIYLVSPPSTERFSIEIDKYLPEDSKKDDYESDSDDEGKQKATN